MTAASETETLPRETPALPPTPPEGALTTPLREDGETGGTRWLRLAAQAPPGPCPVPCRREVPVPAWGVVPARAAAPVAAQMAKNGVVRPWGCSLSLSRSFSSVSSS